MTKILITESQTKQLVKKIISEQPWINARNKVSPVNAAIDNYSAPDNKGYIILPFNNNRAYLDFINYVKKNWPSPSETLKNLLNTPYLTSAGQVVFNPNKYKPADVDKYTKMINNLTSRKTGDTTLGAHFIKTNPQYNRPYTTKVYDSTHVGVIGQQTSQQTSQSNQKVQSAKQAIQWRPNDTFPIKLYDLSPKYITPLQQMLKLPPQQQKGYFGSITLKKLKERGVIIDPEIGIRSQDEYNNAVNTLRGNPQSMDKMTSKDTPTLNNKPNTTKLA